MQRGEGLLIGMLSLRCPSGGERIEESGIQGEIWVGDIHVDEITRGMTTNGKDI